MLEQDRRPLSRLMAGGRKVRAPQDRVLGNSQSRQREGKCNRKQTAPKNALHPSG